MIKHQVYSFSKLDTDNPWVNFWRFGDLQDTRQEYFGDYHESTIKLDPDKVYQMSFDQSSSNTGIFIKDLENTEVHLIEVLRNKGQVAGDYIWDFEQFIHQTCEGCIFSHLIYERPINTKAYRSTQVAFQLEGIICTLAKRYSEFKASKVDNIENPAWFAAVCDKTIDKSYGRKEISRMSVNKLWPWTLEYGSSLYKDNDIFDAIGVMMGWFVASFDALGRPYVRGDRTTRTIGGYVLPGLTGEQVKQMLEKYNIDCEVYIENPRYAIYQNLAAMVRQYKTVCVEFSSKYTMLCLCIECNLKWFDPDVMAVILVDASTVDSRLKEIAGDKFHFVL